MELFGSHKDNKRGKNMYLPNDYIYRENSPIIHDLFYLYTDIHSYSVYVDFKNCSGYPTFEYENFKTLDSAKNCAKKLADTGEYDNIVVKSIRTCYAVRLGYNDFYNDINEITKNYPKKPDDIVIKY